MEYSTQFLALGQFIITVFVLIWGAAKIKTTMDALVVFTKKLDRAIESVEGKVQTHEVDIAVIKTKLELENA